jgi:fatty acyl-CoA reductase
MNLERLRMATEQNNDGEHYFDFDPKTIDWDDYFYRVHIPGVLKYLA